MNFFSHLELLHPIVVHFPIALLITAVFFDLLGFFTHRQHFFQIGLYLLILGIIAGVAAIAIGEWTEELIEAAKIPEEAIEDHERLAFVSVISFSALLLFRWWIKGQWSIVRNRVIYGLLAVIGVAALTGTGYYGGELVYKHGAGVQLPQTTPVQPALKQDPPED
jgi:uncharacterized membrane protein